MDPYALTLSEVSYCLRLTEHCDAFCDRQEVPLRELKMDNHVPFTNAS